MIISNLELTNFRNYNRKSFEFDPRTSIFIGPNGIGKTNIIEAIYLLAAGGSWRTSSTEEMIGFGAEVGHVEGKVKQVSLGHPEERVSSDEGSSPEEAFSAHSDTNNARNSLDPSTRRRLLAQDDAKASLRVTITPGQVNGKHTSKILYKLNSVPKRRSDFIGQLKVVLFEPESLEIIIGDPGHRRAFLDEILIQTDPEYARSSLIYQKSLRTRNRLLDLIREGKSNIESLEYWERALIKHGTYIQDKRRELIEWINLASKGESFCAGILAEYQPNIISPNRLEQYRQNEILAGHTFTGPQKDQLRFKVQSSKFKVPEDLAAFGSRGEQRMAVLKLKLLEARWIEEKTGDVPVILLDDIFSELDEEHEKMVGELIKDKQTIITATELHRGHYPEGKVIQLK